MGGSWTTADYALIISLCSAAISLASFLWNIWSKFIFPKPKLTVGFANMISFSVHDRESPALQALGMTAINHGPGPVILSSAVGRLKRKKLWKKPMGAILKSYTNWPHDLDGYCIGGEGLPRKLEVGEVYQMFLRPSPDNYSELKLFGFSDTFGRTHWADRRAVVRALRSLNKP